MKKIITGLIVFIGLIAVVFIGIVQVTITSNNQLTNDIFKEAKETKSFDDFLAYQTNYFKKIDEQIKTEYKVVVYQIINLDKDLVFNQLIVFTIPITDVNYSKTEKNLNDKTEFIILNDNNEQVFNSRDFNGSTALSYGLSDKRLGFIYQTFDLIKDEILTIKIKDYDGVLYYQNSLNFKFENDINHINDYQRGWNIDEISSKLNLNNKLIKQTTIYITIYLVVVFTIFGGIYIYKKIRN